MRYHVGLDLGQSDDHTALAVANLDGAYYAACRKREELFDRLESARRHPHTDELDGRYLEREIERILGLDPGFAVPETVYEVRHLERMPLGTPYTGVAHRVRALLDTPPLRGNAELAVDATGVGAAVVDLLRSEGLRFEAVTITAGEKQSRDGDAYRVPKRDLIARAQVLLQNRRLKIAAALPEAKTLTEELLNFRYKITPSANVTYETWRENQHDDLLLALCLTLWAAQKPTPSVDESLADTLEDAISEKDLYTWDDPFPWEGR